MKNKFQTNIGTHDSHSVTLRGFDLVSELLGNYSYTEAIYLLITGNVPSKEYARILDACLVVLMDHGLTNHAIVTRLVADCNPNQAQTALAAGLLCVGDVYSGTMDGCARILDQGVREHGDRFDAYCQEVIAAHKPIKKAIPGLGHPIYKPDDPRSVRLFEIAAANGVEGLHINLLKRLALEAEAAYGRHLTINVTGAIAALLLEIGMPLTTTRGVAFISRAGGLVAHLDEGLRTKSGMAIAKFVDDAFQYKE